MDFSSLFIKKIKSNPGIIFLKLYLVCVEYLHSLELIVMCVEVDGVGDF